MVKDVELQIIFFMCLLEGEDEDEMPCFQDGLVVNDMMMQGI